MLDQLPDLASPEARVAFVLALALSLFLAATALVLKRQLAALRSRESLAREELARLAERTARLAEIEADRNARSARLEALSGEAASLAATLAERDGEARRLAQDLGEARAALADLRSRSQAEAAELRKSENELRIRLSTAAADLRARTEELETLKLDHRRALDQREEAQRLLGEARVALADQRSRAEAERKAAAENLTNLQFAKDQLSSQFKALAADILEEKSKSFSEVNRASLGELLNPLKVQLTDFKGKVEDVYVKEGQARYALGEEVRKLMDLNARLSREASNLTSALRGQAKVQGNWGEMILERVLEAAGLKKGIHYVPQESHTREDGSRAQPDIVLNLPGERFMVVDSKVSLVAYDDYANSEAEAEKAAALRRHLDSLHGHIKDLAAKNYQSLHGLKSLDFVILFVPVEPAFLVAVDRDPVLWTFAWERNILLVSPSQLLFVVRTVAQLWQKEDLAKNAQDIAKRGAALYDKLCGFVDDLDRLGKNLRDAQAAYERAYSKFATGNGNVIRQAELLRALGLKTKGRLDSGLVENAMDAEDAAALPAPDEAAG